jgi:aldehyde dehydrogenase (NAD+)
MEEGHSVAQQLKAGAVSVNDASLTAFVHDFSHDSFGFSGVGSSRVGPSAGLRYTREQAILENDSGQAVVTAVIQSS